jgi:hypothetical protein
VSYGPVVVVAVVIPLHVLSLHMNEKAMKPVSGCVTKQLVLCSCV